MIFHWELLKAEWEILKNAYDSQNEVVQEVNKEIDPEVLKGIRIYQDFLAEQEMPKKSNSMTISELLQKYIQENKYAKDWSDKNSRDLEYVLGHLSSFYNDKYINELTRENFSLFRDNVIRNLPKTSQNKDFIGKSTIEIIKIVKRQNCNNYNK